MTRRLQTTPLQTGAIVLRAEQVPEAEQALRDLDFGTVLPGDIIKIGLGSEQALQQTLDGFLARLDKKTAAKVFALFQRLEKGVDDAKLPEILEKIQKGEQPGFFASMFGKLTGRKPEDVVREFMQEVGDLVAGRTRTLADEMQRLELELSKELKTLFGELQALEMLKRSYGAHFASFTVDAAVARAFLDRAAQYVAQEQASAGQPIWPRRRDLLDHHLIGGQSGIGTLQRERPALQQPELVLQLAHARTHRGSWRTA